MNPHHVPGNPFAAQRVLAWHLAQSRAMTARLRARRGAGASDPTLEDLQAIDYDPNVEAGTGTKLPASAADLQSGQSALPAANPGVYGAAQVVATTTVNLRDKPSTSGNILAVEQPGTILTVVGPQQNGWMNVQDPNNVTGWIYSAYLGAAADAGAQQQQAQQGQASAPSSTPSVLTGTAAGSSGLAGLAIVGSVIVLAKYFL